MQTLIILRGYPGSGKTTIGKQLQFNGLGKFVDHNAILAAISKIAGNDTGLCDAINGLELAITEKLLEEGENVIVARGFSQEKSLAPYTEIAQRLGAECQVYRLEAPLTVLEKRVTAAERHEQLNPTTTKEALHAWVHGNPLESVEGEIIIDSTADIATVLNKVVQ